MAGKKRKRGKPKSRGIEKNFVTYGGYIPELDMMLSEDGYYFKMYLADMEEAEGGMGLPPEEHTRFVLGCAGFKIQLIAMKGRAYMLLGTRADSPEEAEKRFRGLGDDWPYQTMTCDQWFGLMSERLRFEPVAEDSGESGKRRGKDKASRINCVQPYNLKRRQKEMEISGRTVKTVILMGYPSRLFAAFATELLGLGDNLALSVYAEELDPKRCLDGMNLSGEIRTARKEAMKAFLEEAVKSGTQIYNTCAFAAIDGLPGEVEDTFRVLKRFCGNYLISVSELDYQQADAWRSVLPLMKNRIRYYRVLTGDNLKALFPWSELKTCKNTVCYGTDVVSGNVFYDRRIHRENGFILAGRYEWALGQAMKELEAYKGKPGMWEQTAILADKNTDVTAFSSGDTRLEEVNCKAAPAWLIKAMIARWAVNGLSTNGRTMRKHVDMVTQAVENLEDGDNGGEREISISDYVERFLSGLGEQEQRALAIRPFVPFCRYRITETGYGRLYQVMESGIWAEIGYALMFWKLHGMVYSLNSERLAWNQTAMYHLHKDTIYTFLAEDIRTLYESRNFSELFRKANFLLLGEHGIYEKLRLSEAAGLNKEQRNWISESAGGAVLMTKLAVYQLVREERHSNVDKKGEG
jgi:hypothetical protein